MYNIGKLGIIEPKSLALDDGKKNQKKCLIISSKIQENQALEKPVESVEAYRNPDYEQYIGIK